MSKSGYIVRVSETKNIKETSSKLYDRLNKVWTKNIKESRTPEQKKQDAEAKLKAKLDKELEDKWKGDPTYERAKRLELD